ncbi:MAG TPA: hemerythrin domain-containing protein [Blastocatellia bacterium]|nr:hemerythrin domain-containing protein [Blastocatellia bacterium]
MNAIELLKKDHQEAMELMDQLEGMGASAAGAGQKELFQRLKNALKLHTSIEEEIFYPAMEKFDEARDMVAEAYQDHEAVDQLLAEMSTLPPGDQEFMDRLAELRDNVENHVDEEEGEMFPQAEQLIGQSRLQEMGRQMQQRKQGRSAAATTSRK